MIPLAKPWLNERETDLIAEVLRTRSLVQGTRVAEFESQVARRIERQHAVAVNSGTTALSLALRALEIGPGDEVLCPALTWPSPANAVAMLGAKPVLIDVDELEWNSGAEHFMSGLSKATKAAIVIDQLGNPARHDEIVKALPGVAIIEDAACALGSSYKKRACGSFGVISCVSFHPRKIITTGEGGLCATDDSKLAAKLQSLRNHGQDSPGKFSEVSGNFRLTEVAAAMGLAQLEKLEQILQHRVEMVERYQKSLSNWVFQSVVPNSITNFQTVGVIPRAQNHAKTTSFWIDEAAKRGVQLGRLSVDASAIGTLPVPSKPVAVAKHIAQHGLALPIYPEMTHAEQDQVIAVLKELGS